MKTVSIFPALAFLFLTLVSPIAAFPIDSFDASLAIIPSKVTEGSDLSTRQLGTAVDICHDPNYANCLVNVDSDPNQCVSMVSGYWDGAAGVSSMNFAGDMQCNLYEAQACAGLPSFTIFQAVPDFGAAGYNWDNKMGSFSCVRWD